MIAEYTLLCPPTTPPYSYLTFFSYVKDTPSYFNFGKLYNISEPVKKIGHMLKYELNSNLELNHTKFDIIYCAVLQIIDAATAVFEKCYKKKDFLYIVGDRKHS